MLANELAQRSDAAARVFASSNVDSQRLMGPIVDNREALDLMAARAHIAHRMHDRRAVVLGTRLTRPNPIAIVRAVLNPVLLAGGGVHW